MKKYLAFLVLIIMAPFVLLLGKYTVVHFEHDAAARRLLVNLRRLPLPHDSRLLFEQAEVGSFIAATGDATDILAYRVFVSDLPAQNVWEFFAPSLKKSSSAQDVGLGVRRLEDGTTQSPYLTMDSILQHAPQAEQSHTYILYSVDRCAEDSLWDIRGW